MPEWNLDTGEMSASPHMIMKASPLRVSVDSKQPIPDNPSLSGANGVAMPGPMKDGDEVGFDAVGRDMRGVKGYAGDDNMPFPTGIEADGLDRSAPSNDQGVMREGFGRGTDGDSREEREPRTNQDFGVASDSGNLGLGDMALNMHLYGTMSSNTEAVREADIIRVFDAVGRGGSGGGMDGGAVELAGRSMAGIPVAHGSGTLGASDAGHWDASAGDNDLDGY